MKCKQLVTYTLAVFGLMATVSQASPLENMFKLPQLPKPRSDWNFCLTHGNPDGMTSFEIHGNLGILVSDAITQEAFENSIREWAESKNMTVTSIQLNGNCDNAEQKIKIDKINFISSPQPSKEDLSYCITKIAKHSYYVALSEMQTEVHITDADCNNPKDITSINVVMKTHNGKRYTQTCNSTSYCEITEKEVGVGVDRYECSLTTTNNKGLTGSIIDNYCY